MSSLAGALDPPSKDSYTYQDDAKMDATRTNQSDAEDNTGSQDDEEMEDLFGNDDVVQDNRSDEYVGSSLAPSRLDSERSPSPEREHRQALEYEEKDDHGEVAVVEAEVAFPNIPVPHSSDGNNWVIRMPNYVHVEPKPFEADYYYGPEQYEDFGGPGSQLSREKSAAVKLRVDNTLRWRWQSNARIIRWSDGSLSLRLGKELFDVHQATEAAPNSQASGSQTHLSQPLSQSQSQSDRPTDASKGQSLTYLVAQHKRAMVLQAEGVVAGQMTLRPTGMQSETHRQLARAVGQKHHKVARLRMAADPTMDPEKEIQELAKANAKKSKKKFDEGGSGRRKKSRGSRRRIADVWSDDDDEDDAAFAMGSDDEFATARASGGAERRKGGAGEEGEGKAGYQEDDFLVADYSSDDDGDRKKRRSEMDTMEDDPLDKLEEKLQAQEEAAKKRQRVDDESDAGDKMDVESEDEDEQAIRTVTAAPGRKRRVLDFDDDEEE
ncbi:Leo1-like protein-domain-containing protein [Pterulicium gracile]|uniref:Leo1-like protein-domain-containing protein n=1 Tax=Pterulicium gracile TaxID=1884261 RepID=A0A5C3QTR8_9AGAR|nr:Leo1-like protein-domain-containing protein [Pterula gracilis]